MSFSADKRVQRLVQHALISPETTGEVRSALLAGIGRLGQLPEVWAEPLGDLLQLKDESVQLQTISALASSRTTRLNGHLRRLGQDDSAAERVRLAAWICLAAKGSSLPKEAFLLLANRVTAPIEPLDRLAAAKALASAQLDASQLIQVADALPNVKSLELPTLIEAFGQPTTKDADLGARFLAALARSRASSGLSAAQLQRILQTFPEKVRQDAKPLLAKLHVDDQQMAERLKQMTASLSAGDAERGQAVFFSNRAACSACHTAGGRGGNIGPDLSRIGTIRTRPDLLEAILFPSASIVNNFETYSVLTKDGRIQRGIIQRATVDWIVLRNEQRSEIVVSRADVEQLVRNKSSIMPQGLDNNLSLEQISDLLAYLQSLRLEVGGTNQTAQD